MTPLTLSPWKKHVLEWSDCMRCELCRTRQTVVLARGKVPCDVLFIGEAPGESENALGVPFVGPAGKLLDDVIERAFEGMTLDGPVHPEIAVVGRQLRWAFTNVVCCIPRDDELGKLAEPPDEAVQACQPRLVEFVRLADPRLIVTLGKTAREALEPGLKRSPKFHKKILQAHVVHPAAVLRMPEAQRGVEVRRAVAVISSAVEKLSATL